MGGCFIRYDYASCVSSKSVGALCSGDVLLYCLLWLCFVAVLESLLSSAAGVPVSLVSSEKIRPQKKTKATRQTTTNDR